jgi:N-methylhydantoinase A
LQQLAHTCQARLDSAGVRFESIQELVHLDMLYAGQTHTLSVKLEAAALTRQGIQQAFEQTYQQAFGRILQGLVIRVLNLRYARIGVRPKLDLKVLAPQGEGSQRVLGLQTVYHQGTWWEARRLARLDLPVGACVEGPAILEQPDTTVWLEPGFVARVDALGNLCVQQQEPAA